MKIICECRLFQFRWVAIWFGMIYWSTVPINGNAKSLDSAKVHWIAGAGITSSGIGVVAWVHPGLVWRNHILFAGMGQTLLSGHSLDPKPYLLGLLYQYFPNPPGRRFDLFFQFEGERELRNSFPQMGLYAGYGLSIRIFRNGFIRTNYGLGLLLNRKITSIQTTKRTWEIGGNFRLGFGFRF